MKIGCNYWASHAGTRMWELWDETVVKEDLRLLAAYGCEMLRVFPIWKVFQPIEICHTAGGWIKDVYMHGKPLPDTFCGQAGVDEEMIRRFRRFAEIAQECHLKLRVGVVTGWMSGSFYCPPALEKTDVMTDPMALRYMVKFIRCFVRMVKDCPAIEEWELGNECNNLQELHNSHAAWLWTHLVSSAIRLEDPDRKVASGMHGLRTSDIHGRCCVWSIQTQGELCDRMTPHPYPHSGSKTIAKIDCHDSFRTMLESTIEMLYYGNLVDRPYSVEEIGTLSTSFASESMKAIFLRGALHNTWAHGASDFLWWCAFDQGHLDFPPYQWSAYERELGMFDALRRPKKLLVEFQQFKAFRDSLPIKELPLFRGDAVCVITRSMDMDINTALDNAGSCFLLAKQNHFDINFQYTLEHFKDAPLYLVPGVFGDNSLYGYEWSALLEKVKDGAVLYVSMDTCVLTGMEAVFGVEVSNREMRSAPALVQLEGEIFSVTSEFKTSLNILDAEVLAHEEDGNPVYIRHRYGKGFCYLCTLPIEKHLGNLPGAFHKTGQPAWHRFYTPLWEHVRQRRCINCDNRFVTLTEHPESEDVCYAVAVNNSKEETSVRFCPAAGWVLHDAEVAVLAPFAGMLLKLTRL
ncbi:MAG: hypothetical protein IJJ33_05205 [Victivallales bacterium]|nr:hypothetical protein [Victivallales bacterium]